MGKFSILILFSFCIVFTSFAQLRPGQLYDENQDVYAPGYGVRSKVPEGWAGVLPMNTEVFLLMPKDNSYGQIYVVAQEDSYETLKTRWQNGITLDNGVIVKSTREPVFRNGNLSATITVVNNKGMGGYAEAICGDFGVCLVAFLFAPHDLAPKLSDALKEFIDNTSLEEPKEVDPYAEFDWKNFLGNKYMANYERLQGSKKESEIWFCPDGSFRSRLKGKGVFADKSNNYMGNKRGIWEVSGVGPSAVLTLTIKNLEPISLNMLIREEKIYANGVRFFFMNDDSCK